MNMTTRTRGLLLGASVLALAAQASAPAFAQSASGAPADAVEEVVVTGSRVITNSNNSPTPLTTVTTEKLTQTTPSSIPDGLNKLPQFVPSAATRNTHTLNLRGLGAERSLILFNGARVPSTAAGGAINIDTLPQMLIQRVDVVTGGTSAVYGSDAITGVVNFIVDKNYNGIKAFAQTGISSPYRDRRSYKYGVAAGGNVFGDKLHLEGSYERFTMDAITSKVDRPLGVKNYVATGSGTAANPFRATVNSRFLTYSPGGYIVIPRTANPAPGALQGDFVFATDGVLSPFNHGAATGSSGLESGGGGGSGSLGDVADTTLTPPTATHQGFLRADMDIGSNTHAYLQGSLVTQEEVFNTYPIWFQRDIFVDNPFLPDSVRAGMVANGMTKFTMGKAIHNFPSNTSSSKKRSYSFTAGLDGKLADKFTWNGYYTHAQTRDHAGFLDSTDQEKLMVSMDAVRDSTGKIVCRVSTTAAGSARFPGCVPTNLFGPNAVDVGAFNYWSVPTVVDTINKMDDVAGSIVGDVINGWAGPITMALSGEYRRYSLEIKSPYNNTQLVDCSFTPATICPATLTKWQFGVTNPLPKRTQSVKEAALEVNVPLLRDAPLAKSLDLSLAGRYADYSYSGSAKIWKAGLVWDVDGQLKVRATASKDFRAPSLNDLFRTQSSSQGSTTDLLTGTSGGYRGLSGGNPNLTAETSRTNALGVVYRPDWAPRLSVALDWYDIKITQAIGNVNGIDPSVQNECINSGGTSPYCAFYVRPLPFSNRTPANFFISVLSQPFNAARASTKGIDGEVNYSMDAPAFLFGDSGKIDTRLLVSYQPKLLTLPLPGAQVLDAAGAAGLAEWRVNANVTYTTGPLSATVTQRWWSSENQNSNPTLIFDAGKIPSATYTDLNVSYRFGDRDGKQPYQAYLSIENLFNRQPDLWLQTGQAGAPGQVFPTPGDQDVVGRYVTVGIRANF
jgi:iron complex outermembrane receptor protein